MKPEDRAFLTGPFEAAVRAADPAAALRANLPDPPKGRTVVVGAGKGAAQLAAAALAGTDRGGGRYPLWLWLRHGADPGDGMCRGTIRGSPGTSSG